MSMDTVTAGGRARVLADGNEIPLVGLGAWQVGNDRNSPQISIDEVASPGIRASGP